MGLVLIGLATLERVGVTGAVFQMFSHGIMTALFFAAAGVIYDRAHTRDLSAFQGLAKRMPFTATCLILAGLASLGMPGLSGFIAEFMVFVGAFRTYPVVGLLGIIGAALTAIYILRMLAASFFGPLDERWQNLPEASRPERFAMAVLGLILVLGGVWPMPLTRLISSGVEPIIAKITGTL
jgi:NADH-quinone oxidoreductase subunit M